MNVDELIQKYKNTKNKKYLLMIIDKYLEQIFSIEIKFMQIYKNIYIYREDFESLRYLAVIKAVKTFSNKYKHKFVQHYLRIYKSEVRDYCRKFTKKSDIPMNYAISYDEREYFKNYIPSSENVEYLALLKDTINSLLNYKNNKISETEKFIVIKKSHGFTNKEISKIINKPTSYISNIYSKALIKMRNNYKNLF